MSEVAGQHKYPEEVRLKAVEMFKAGTKPEVIAAEIGCSEGSVYFWVNTSEGREVVPERKKPGPKPKDDGRLSRDERDKLVLTMFEQGITPTQIRKQLNIGGAGVVGDILRKHGRNPYENTPPNKTPKEKKPEQANLALPLSPAEQMLAARAARAQPAPANEDVHALRRTIVALRTERDALRRALDEIIGQ